MPIRVAAVLAALFFAVATPAAERKTFDPVVLDAILHKECAVVDGCFYPWFVGFNKKTHIAAARRLLSEWKGLRFKGRLMFCDAEAICVRAAKRLVSEGIVNIDLGPYQINPKFNPWVRIEDLFSFRRARAVAWRIVNDLAARHGLSWRTLGRYHSSTEHLNRRYYMGLYRYIYGHGAEATR